MQHEQYNKICSFIREIIKGTRWEGHVFAVGGCVRDYLMGNEIKDIDVVVDLPNGGLCFAQWLKDEGFISGDIVTYPRFGTAMFHLLAFPDEELECVQSRKEKYPDATSRNPETSFGSIEDDSFRRDLTINTLDENLSTGALADVTGHGQDDIRNHIIRTPLDPDITYDDDPLRILRCIRFASRFGWKIEKETFLGLQNNSYRLAIITHERIRDEFEKMLTSKYPAHALKLLRETGAMKFVIPELEETYDMAQNQYHFGTVWEHTLKVIELVESSDLTIRLAALLHDIGKIHTREITLDGNIHFIDHQQKSAELVEDILRRLRYSNILIREVKFLVTHHMDTKTWRDDLSQMKPKHLRKLQHLCQSEERFKNLMLLIDADNKAHAEGFCLKNQAALIIEQTEKMKQEGSALFNYKLPFTGREVMQLKGLPPGLGVRQTLDYLLKLAYVDPLRDGGNWVKNLLGFKPKG